MTWGGGEDDIIRCQFMIHLRIGKKLRGSCPSHICPPLTIGIGHTRPHNKSQNFMHPTPLWDIDSEVLQQSEDATFPRCV